MPYLTERRKNELRRPHPVTGKPQFAPITAGDLTYLLTVDALAKRPFGPLAAATIGAFLDALNEPPRYGDYCTILGALDATAREYARRMAPEGIGLVRGLDAASRVLSVRSFAKRFYDETVAPYEDVKIEQNGDVYPCE